VALLEETSSGLVPLPDAAGYWGSKTLAGQVVCGVFGRAVERCADERWRVARLTVDLVRMTSFATVQITTSVVHRSRRLTVVDAVLRQDGCVAARASALLVPRGGSAPTGRVWSEEACMPPPPASGAPSTARPLEGLLAYAGDDLIGSPSPTRWSGGDEPKYLWWDLNHELVAGEEMSPLTRAAFVADTANPLTAWGTHGLEVINADMTLTLARDPRDTVLGLGARSFLMGGGTTTGMASMHDRHGAIGVVAVISLTRGGG
jgi:hypothetical protein